MDSTQHIAAGFQGHVIIEDKCLVSLQSFSLHEEKGSPSYYTNYCQSNLYGPQPLDPSLQLRDNTSREFDPP